MQQKKTTKEEYQKCVNVVVEYINQHLGEDIDLKSLARISNFSPFYFHRIMKAFLGSDCRHRLPDWLLISFFVVESVQAILWHFTFRV